MKKKLLIGLTLTILAVPCVASIQQSSAVCNGEEFSYIKLEEKYDLNDQIVIPGAFIEIDGVNYQAKQIITFPSGKRTYDTKISLNEVGIYTLEYYFDKDNKHYSQKDYFTVVSSFFDIGENSSAYYGVPDECGTKGLVVELSQNEIINFNQTIDISTITDTSTFIESYIVPYSRGVADFGALLFTFYNPLDNQEYITFRLSSSPSERIYLALADVSVQGNGTDFVADDKGDLGYIHHNDGDGTKVRVSFRGATEQTFTDGKTDWTGECLSAPFDTTKLRIDFDYASKKTYTYNSWFSDDGTISSPDAGKRLLSSDLDDPTYVGSRMWQGFTNNYVKLKVSADSYSGSKARFVISKINGLDLNALEIEDTNGPQITVYTPYEEMPLGKTGAHYPLPEASAIDDIDGEVRVTRKVWRNYGADNASNLEDFGGYFIPDAEGEYIVEYTAMDSAGNNTVELLPIYVSDTVDPIVVNIKEDEKITSTYIGTLITLPSATYLGGSGDLSLKIYARFGTYSELIGEERNFTPEKIGDWTISYIVTDFLGVTKEESYTLSVLNSPTPILAEPFFGDEFIVCYSDYAFPSPKIVEYIDDVKVESDYQIKVTLNGATSTHNKGEKFYLGNIDNGTNIQFDYYCGQTLITSFKAKIINPFTLNKYQAKQLAIENYFISDDADIVFDEPSTETPAYKIGAKLVSTGNDVSSLKFANYVLSDTFEFNFTTFKNNSICDSYDLVLTDSINKNNHLTIKIEEENGGFYASVPGSKKELIKNVSNGTYDEFNIKYSQCMLEIGNAKLFASLNDKNIIFNGFASNKISVEFKANALQPESYVIINKVGNEGIVKSSKSLNDYIAPELFIFDNVVGTYDLGDVVTTSKAVAQDVLAYESVLTVSVINENTSEYVKDIHGNEIKEMPANVSYDFLLDDISKFIITYTTYERYQGQDYWQRKNVNEQSVVVTCIDKDAPVITFTSFMPDSCKVNDVVALPKFNVVDGYGTDGLVIWRYMVVPSGVVKSIDQKANSYQFIEKGVYEYRIVARDKSGNFGINSLFITVK